MVSCTASANSFATFGYATESDVICGDAATADQSRRAHRVATFHNPLMCLSLAMRAAPAATSARISCSSLCSQ